MLGQWLSAGSGSSFTMPTIPWLEQKKNLYFFSVDSFLKASFVFTLTKHNIICVKDVCAVSILYRNIERNYKQSLCIIIWVSRPVYMYHALIINQCIYYTGMVLICSNFSQINLFRMYVQKFKVCCVHWTPCFTDPDPFIKVLRVFMVGKVAVKPFVWR